MKVKELIKLLQEKDPEKDVFIQYELCGGSDVVGVFDCSDDTDRVYVCQYDAQEVMWEEDES